MPAVNEFEPKSICADDCAAVNDNSGTNSRSLTNRYSRINFAAVPDNGLVTNIALCADNGVVADAGGAFNYGVWLNGNSPAKLGARIDNRCRMNAGRKF